MSCFSFSLFLFSPPPTSKHHPVWSDSPQGMHRAGAGSICWKSASNKTGDHRFCLTLKKRLFRCSFLFLLPVLLKFPQELQSERPHVGLVFPNRDWLGTGVFKSSPVSLHRHREDLHAELQILKRFSFSQSLSVLAAREYTIQGWCKAEKRMLQKLTQYSSSLGLNITKQPH